MQEGIINKEFMQRAYMIEKEEDMMLLKKLVITLLNNYPINKAKQTKIDFINDICNQIITYRHRNRTTEKS